MWEKFSEHWPFWILSTLAVVSGQIGRLGHRAEKGQKLTTRRIWIELSMLPAFGSIGGSLAAEHQAPVWIILSTGVAAGWMGFACFKFLANIVVAIVTTMAEKVVASRTPPPQ